VGVVGVITPTPVWGRYSRPPLEPLYASGQTTTIAFTGGSTINFSQKSGSVTARTTL